MKHPHLMTSIPRQLG